MDKPDPERVDRLERAILALPRINREVFLAHRLDRMTYSDIARITGLSERQVRRQVMKAVQQAYRYLDGDERTAWQRRWQSLASRWFR